MLKNITFENENNSISMLTKILMVKTTLTFIVCIGAICLYAQCDGPYDSGNVIMLTSSVQIQIPISADDYKISFPGSAPGAVVISSSTGLRFLQSSMNPLKARLVSMGEDISALGPYIDGLLEIYNSSNHTGPLGGGNGGFIPVEKNGRFGWIEFADCGTKSCMSNEFEFRVTERCLNGVSGGTVLAGNVATLSPAASIPTLTEWALISLSLLLLIIGVQALRSFKEDSINIYS